MDDADMAQERQEREFQYLIAGARKPNGPTSTGSCLWCNEPVKGDLRWCDADCFSDYNRAETTRQKQGIRRCHLSETSQDSD